ncbi:MAG: Ribosome maturation factor RimP [Candidatus Omnitrophica bacterium]|nr:Ribosome maturation factor RimP [Candidatus Omnitrophota bacterium]
MLVPEDVRKIEPEIRAIVEGLGGEIVALEYRRGGGRTVLTVLADKPTGITLDDCGEISRRIGLLIDESNGKGEGLPSLSGSYLLEVSSPGADRPLKSLRDFEKAIGKTLDVQAKGAEPGRIWTFRATLENASADGLVFRMTKDGSLESLALERILRAAPVLPF